MSWNANTIHSHRDLVVWQRAMELVVACYAAGRRFPSSERYALQSQLCRAAVSVAANVAEGHGRRHRREYLQFIAIAHASLQETETHLEIAHRVGYLDDAHLASIVGLCTEVGRMLTSLRKALTSRPD